MYVYMSLSLSIYIYIYMYTHIRRTASAISSGSPRRPAGTPYIIITIIIIDLMIIITIS